MPGPWHCLSWQTFELIKFCSLSDAQFEILGITVEKEGRPAGQKTLLPSLPLTPHFPTTESPGLRGSLPLHLASGWPSVKFYWMQSSHEALIQVKGFDVSFFPFLRIWPFSFFSSLAFCLCLSLRTHLLCLSEHPNRSGNFLVALANLILFILLHFFPDFF